MAIFRLSASIISRVTGRSATAAAAYRAGARIADERTGQAFDYERRRGVLHAEILVPPRTPVWMQDREALWNAVEKVEKRRDAQLAREIQLALPHELDLDQQLTLVRNFAKREFVRLGMIVDVAIHAPHRSGDIRNVHAHLLLTMRELTDNGFGKKARDWNVPGFLENWRITWAREVNAALERVAITQRVDHRTLEAQKAEAIQIAADAYQVGDEVKAEIATAHAITLDREPEPKIGVAANALERRGIVTERAEAWRAARARNDMRQRARYALDRVEQAVTSARAALRAAVFAQREAVRQIAARLDRVGARIREQAARMRLLGEHSTERTGARADLAEPQRVAVLGKDRPTEAKGQRLDHETRRTLLGEPRRGEKGRPMTGPAFGDRDRDD